MDCFVLLATLIFVSLVERTRAKIYLARARAIVA